MAARRFLRLQHLDHSWAACTVLCDTIHVACSRRVTLASNRLHRRAVVLILLVHQIVLEKLAMILVPYTFALNRLESGLKALSRGMFLSMSAMLAVFCICIGYCKELAQRNIRSVIDRPSLDSLCEPGSQVVLRSAHICTLHAGGCCRHEITAAPEGCPACVHILKAIFS